MRARRAALAPPLATLSPSRTGEAPGTAHVLVFDLPRMSSVAIAIVAAPLVIAIYAYIGYPAALWVITRFRVKRGPPQASNEWPTVTVTVPVYNAMAGIRATLEGLMSLDYPRDKLQLLVLSDASTDGTDDVVREFAHRGVELLRAPKRLGKTAGENAAHGLARGELIVNVDASVVIPPQSLKRLVQVFVDPSIGVASGRDVSIGGEGPQVTGAESKYIGYEMWVRELETHAGSIVGASGCFYGIRRDIHAKELPPELSWDFASSLIARKQGYRSVSVPDAVCIVPRTPQIRTELRRKVRTMARGLNTLFFLRELMNPTRYGGFALMLVSHKLLRWLPYLLAPVSLLALGVLAFQNDVARASFVAACVGLALGAFGIRYSRFGESAPITAAAFVVAVFTAGFLAWCDALRGVRTATWEPTPRPDAGSARARAAA
jgi:cellulose synthase/poly-beta-1,6-N-acetylglucosamine synthase-like glycosyltransferase